MTHSLDRPVWGALSTRHAALAEGDALAKRYPTSIVPFAATKDNDKASLLALRSLVGPEDTIFMLQADPIALPDELSAVSTADGVQMIARHPFERLQDPCIEPLTERDAADMLALASLTKPGPFTLRALELGSFWGIKIDGRLVAMAGERMKQPGFTELSGVCSHPDARGRGFGRTLSLFVAGEISARDETPYLHAYASNEAAIKLYRSIGFEKRCDMNVAVVKLNEVTPLSLQGEGSRAKRGRVGVGQNTENR